GDLRGYCRSWMGNLPRRCHWTQITMPLCRRDATVWVGALCDRSAAANGTLAAETVWPGSRRTCQAFALWKVGARPLPPQPAATVTTAEAASSTAQFVMVLLRRRRLLASGQLH